MSSAIKVFLTCLAAFAIFMFICMILGLFQWIVIGAVIVGVIVIAVRAVGSSRRGGLPAGDRKLHKQLKKLEKDIQSIRRD